MFYLSAFSRFPLQVKVLWNAVCVKENSTVCLPGRTCSSCLMILLFEKQTERGGNLSRIKVPFITKMSSCVLSCFDQKFPRQWELFETRDTWRRKISKTNKREKEGTFSLFLVILFRPNKHTLESSREEMFARKLILWTLIFLILVHNFCPYHVYYSFSTDKQTEGTRRTLEPEEEEEDSFLLLVSRVCRCVSQTPPSLEWKEWEGYMAVR